MKKIIMSFFAFVFFVINQRESDAFMINTEKMACLDKMNVLIDLDAMIMMTSTLDSYSGHQMKYSENSSVLIRHSPNFLVVVSK